MPARLTITEVERITLDVPFRPRVRPWNALLVGQWRVSEIVRVVTDAGIVGHGETLPHYTWGRVTDDAVAPPHYRLAREWNEMLVPAGNALPVLPALDRCERVAIYESPITHGALEGYRQLRRQVARPLALHFDAPPFAIAQRQEVCDGF